MEIKEGFLRVTGSGSIQIRLDGLPKDVRVEFLEEEIVPCNHHHHHHHHHHHRDHHPDTLEWRVACKIVRRSWWHETREYVLELKWRVESIRTIKWVVRY